MRWIVKVSREDLVKFVRRHGDAWNLNGFRGLTGEVGERPLTSEELLRAISERSPRSKYVFVRKALLRRSRRGTDETKKYVDAANECDIDGLEDFIVRKACSHAGPLMILSMSRNAKDLSCGSIECHLQLDHY